MTIGSVNAGNYASIPVLRTFSADQVKTVNARELPGTAERAARLIESAAHLDVGRAAGVKGYGEQVQRQEAVLQAYSSYVDKLSAGTSQKERDAWAAKLAGLEQEVADSRSQVALYQSFIDADPVRDTTLSFTAGLLGMSTEDVNKLYADRVKALESERGAVGASAAAPSGAHEWGNEKSGLRAEIKVDGKVIGRVYNGGGVELADEYSMLGFELGFGGPGEEGLEGPDLAESRIARLATAFENARFEVVMAPTALNQAEWAALQADGQGGVDRTV